MAQSDGCSPKRLKVKQPKITRFLSCDSCVTSPMKQKTGEAEPYKIKKASKLTKDSLSPLDADGIRIITQGNGNKEENIQRKPRNPNIDSNRIDHLISKRKRDTEKYRNNYPDLVDDKNSDDNLKFYQNLLQSMPDGDFIDNIHKNWWGNYQRLEQHHGYIQWLFPIRESGMNYRAKELQLHEAEAIKASKECSKRVVKSYEMMLDFYGIKREDDHLCRGPKWKQRFEHLNRSFHNYLRITRILKSLGELGLEDLKLPFVEFMLHEIIKEGTLTNCFDSCMSFWIMVLRDEHQRNYAIKLAKHLCDQYNGINLKSHGTNHDAVNDSPTENDRLFCDE